MKIYSLVSGFTSDNVTTIHTSIESLVSEIQESVNMDGIFLSAIKDYAASNSELSDIVKDSDFAKRFVSKISNDGNVEISHEYNVDGIEYFFINITTHEICLGEF